MCNISMLGVLHNSLLWALYMIMRENFKKGGSMLKKPNPVATRKPLNLRVQPTIKQEAKKMRSKKKIKSAKVTQKSHIPSGSSVGGDVMEEKCYHNVTLSTIWFGFG